MRLIEGGDVINRSSTYSQISFSQRLN